MHIIVAPLYVQAFFSTKAEKDEAVSYVDQACGDYVLMLFISALLFFSLLQQDE